MRGRRSSVPRRDKRGHRTQRQTPHPIGLHQASHHSLRQCQTHHQPPTPFRLRHSLQHLLLGNLFIPPFYSIHHLLLGFLILILILITGPERPHL